MLVTNVHNVTGLIQGAAAGANAPCIYPESFSISLLSTIATRTQFPELPFCNNARLM
jgi:hypothetical protein